MAAAAEAAPKTLAALNYNTKRRPGQPFDEAQDGKLGSVYTLATEVLLSRGDFVRLPALRNKETNEVKLPPSFNVLFGTAQGKGIQWGRLGYGIWPPPLVNYYRGFEVITRKGRLAATLERAEATCEGTWPADFPDELKSSQAAPSADAVLSFQVWELAPATFCFHPSKGDANPFEKLRAAVEQASAARDGGALVAWIMKPSDGCKGDGIEIAESWEAIEAHLTQQFQLKEEGGNPPTWVVQRYISNPLLLSRGQRKFDMRCWVLLDGAYNVYLYSQGVLRTSAVAYDVGDTTNRFAHLTNHCIAANHADFGKFEETNELFYSAFDAELNERFPELAVQHGGSVLRGVVEPQIKRHVVQTFLAAREQLEHISDYYFPFQLFGFDFLLTDELRLWLCEVNASPAVAEVLLQGLVQALIATAIDPVFLPEKPAPRETCSSEFSGKFECIFQSGRPWPPALS